MFGDVPMVWILFNDLRVHVGDEHCKSGNIMKRPCAGKQTYNRHSDYCLLSTVRFW